MLHSIPEQLRFSPAADFTIRDDLTVTDCLLISGRLREVDRQIGLTTRITEAPNDERHSGYIKHSMSGVLQQCIDQISSGYGDGDDRINRINYEIEVLQTLRERLRSKEI